MGRTTKLVNITPYLDLMVERGGSCMLPQVDARAARAMLKAGLVEHYTEGRMAMLRLTEEGKAFVAKRRKRPVTDRISDHKCRCGEQAAVQCFYCDVYECYSCSEKHGQPGGSRCEPKRDFPGLS